MTLTIPTPVRAPSSDRRGTQGRSARRSLLSRIGPMGIMTIAAAYVLMPLWWLLVSASKDQGQLVDGNPLWFSDVSVLSNLQQLFAYRDGLFLRWLLNSLAYTGGAALLGTLLAGMCGYALAKYRFPGRELLFNVILGGVLVPATALALPLFLMFSAVHAANTFWAVFLPSLVNPFGVYLARVYATTSVPADLLEAARIDGAGEVRTFFTVSARLMTPAFLTIFLFHFVAIWNNFLLPLIMLGDEKLFPVTLGLYTWNTQATQNPELRGLVLIGALVSIVPMIVVFLSLQRFWRGGLGAGSLK
ncbi:carbohydrate ABC transporter permease [Krasilnikovia sp. M28-CT-15]|uniref:carbohydrate ABC transporter permease n=1 Tax=Krasilnikovia sp. M28-CT-15 TaxID=3373540 RepID=UPI00387664A3